MDADIIVDGIGGDILSAALEVLAPGGSLTTLGYAASRKTTIAIDPEKTFVVRSYLRGARGRGSLFAQIFNALAFVQAECGEVIDGGMAAAVSEFVETPANRALTRNSGDPHEAKGSCSNSIHAFDLHYGGATRPWLTFSSIPGTESCKSEISSRMVVRRIFE